MKSKHALLASAIVPIVFAVTFSIVIWPNASAPAKLAFFFLGFWAGISLGGWIGSRKEAVN